jgi:hypothetical protein
MLMVALPLLSVEADDANEPLLKVTEPVGVAAPDPPATDTATDKACEAVMLEAEGVTVTVGVTNPAGAATVTEAVPEALLNVPELALSGV